MMKKILFVLVFLTFFISQTSIVSASVRDIKIISKSNADVLGDADSGDAILSGDGKFIVTSSGATNLVADDTNGFVDVFVYDIEVDSIERISLDDLGNEGDDDSFDADISEDGRYVAFISRATNLVSGDINAKDDIFLYDRDTDTVELISLDSSDGPSNQDSSLPSISSDGRYVVFESFATDLVSGDTNAKTDVFMRDTLLDTTERVSVSDLEAEGNNDSHSPSMSLDGRYVGFMSSATNLVSGDTNGLQDYFIRDTVLGTTERINVSSSEQQANDDITNISRHMISTDGRYIVFGSLATNLISGDTNSEDDIFVRDRTLGITERITLDPAGDEVSGVASVLVTGISPDGRYVSFYSDSDQFVEDDTNGVHDVFVRDLVLDTTRRVSLSASGEEGDGDSYSTVISFSEGGRYVVFNSGSTNFVDNDNNGFFDVFYAEIMDDDGVVSTIEDSSPNAGDVDEDGYDDAIEEHVTSFVNSVSGNYSTIETSGDCISNSNPSAVAENTLGSQDPAYDYPLGIISFEVGCKNAGETATVSVYCFCEVTPVDGTIARKYDEDTGEYTTIDSAVIEEVTIGGQRALKMTYDVVDGGELDEDGLSNGTIIDPVGFARVATSSGEGNNGGGSSGSRPRARVAYETNNQSIPSNNSEICTIFITPMKKGSKFGEVSKLQTELNTLGFNSGTVDGLFGSITDTAVKAFQKSKNLIADGIVGPITRASLNDCK